MGWDVVRHKDKKKTESGVYHADMTARCLVWTSVEDINDMDGGRDSTSFPFPLSGFTSSDAEKERKRRVMFSEIVDLTKVSTVLLCLQFSFFFSSFNVDLT